MTTQAAIWAGAAAALAVAAGSGAADWRRGRRRNLDAAGWVPWSMVQVISLFAALALAMLAARS
jgi:hypothetical protein